LVEKGIIDENGEPIVTAPSTQIDATANNFEDCVENSADQHMASPTKGMNGGLGRMSLSENPEEFD
jgi:hypothetical protein